MKGIAILTKRSPVLPNLPTAVEQGLDVQAYTWNAIYLPKGAPADVVRGLHDAALDAMHTPSVRERLKASAPPSPRRTSEPEMLGQFAKSEIKKWAAPIKASGVVGLTALLHRLVDQADVGGDHAPALGEFHPGLHLPANLAGR